MMDNRGQGLFRVIFWFVGILFSLWIFLIILGNVLEPLYQFAVNWQAVQDMGYASGLKLFWPILSIWAPVLLGLGGIVLIIIFAAFRERFADRRVPR